VGAIFGRYECHATFLPEIKSGAIWQKTKILSTKNLIFPRHAFSRFEDVLSLSSEIPEHWAKREKSNKTTKSEARNSKQSPMTQNE